MGYINICANFKQINNDVTVPDTVATKIIIN